MIPRTAPSWHTESSLSWQEQLQQAITDPAQLLKQLHLSEQLLPAAILASQQFSLKVPQSFVSRMTKADPDDPLLRQVLPLQQELIAKEGYSTDPLAEQVNNQPGVIQKYHGRVLLMVNGHCAVNCRYCFRRHFPYQEHRLNRGQWQTALEYIANDRSIEEVIYSGGDPLASGDKQLQWLTQQISTIDHVKRLRIHTRLPVVIPDRITPECLDWLTNHRLSTIVVLHINHPNEIDSSLARAIAQLRVTGITLLNQAVLLRGVNDRLETLKTLHETLFDHGVLPYYLHLLDPVSGASHFDVPNTIAEQLYQQLLACQPGYLVPKLVREVPGAASKTPAQQR